MPYMYIIEVDYYGVVDCRLNGDVAYNYCLVIINCVMFPLHVIYTVYSCHHDKYVYFDIDYMIPLSCSTAIMTL